MFRELGKANFEQDANKQRPLLMEGRRLAGDVAVSATSIQINSLPRGVGGYSGWVVIDPYTVECEVRAITSRTGRLCTVSALTYAHSKFDEVIFVDRPWLDAKWFGALGDNATDDTTALQRAMTQIGLVFGRLAIPSGTYLTTLPLTQPRRTIVQGHTSVIDSQGTIIKADTGWAGTSLYLMGDSTSAFGTQLLDICIDCNGLVNTGVFSDQIEEGSGCRNVRVREFAQYGFRFQNGGASSGKNPRNFFLEHLYCTVSSSVVSGDEVGVYLSGANDVTGYNHIRGIDGLTVDVTPSGGTNGLAAVRLIDCRGTFLSRIHGEGVDYVVDFQEDNQGCTAVGISGSGDTATVHIGTPGNDTITLAGIWPKTTTGATLIDDKNSVTIADPIIIPLYVAGGDSRFYSGDLYSDAWQDYSATSTVTGWASFTSKLIYFKTLGKTVMVRFILTGTSSPTTGTAASFTLPYAPTGVTVHEAIPIQDNGVAAFGRCAMATGSTTVNAYPDAASGNWTASGTKVVRGSFEYQMA